MKIITLTLNPAFDIHCNVPNFAPYHENLAYITSNDAGGKGINISRALAANGVDNLAFVLLGDENGESFEKALKHDAIHYCKLTVKGKIRENITCHTDGVPETRISFAGFNIDETLLAKVSEILLPETDSDTVITFTGRVPAGLSMDSVKAFLRSFMNMGARIVIDSRSFSLNDLREMKPWLIKPNQEEISEYLGRDIGSVEEIIPVAEDLHADGIENVMISLGGDGAMVVCSEGVFVARPPKIEALSTIGAGDSSIAGFLAAAKNGDGGEKRLSLAVAYGSAACMTEGTKPPRRVDIETLLPLVKAEKIK